MTSALRVAQHRVLGGTRGERTLRPTRMTWPINTYQLDDLFGGDRHRPTPLALSLGMSPQLRGLAQMAYTSKPDIGGIDPFRASSVVKTGSPNAYTVLQADPVLRLHYSRSVHSCGVSTETPPF